MESPYLKILGKRVEKGTKYWSVSGLSPFRLNEQIACNQNNTINTCYFLDYGGALSYKKMCESSNILSETIKEIENIHAWESGIKYSNQNDL